MSSVLTLLFPRSAAGKHGFSRSLLLFKSRVLRDESPRAALGAGRSAVVSRTWADADGRSLCWAVCVAADHGNARWRANAR